ncbi:thymidylate kinase [Pseudohalioglobus sediminis]|nr:thymidylate kinase [Pseudohalioglobus sediminis]
MKAKPKFIIISGIDGSGKTTIIDAVKDRLEDKGVQSQYIWLRYNHIIIKPVHALCRLVGLSKRYDSIQGKVWRHEFYKSQSFCSIYIFLTWLDTWLGRFKITWRLRGINVDVVICDRWVNDILIDLAVDSRRDKFLESRWRDWFQRILPDNAQSFLITRHVEDVLGCRPECRDDPDFEFRQRAYRQLQESSPNLIVLSNDGSIEQAVNTLLDQLDDFDRRLA